MMSLVGEPVLSTRDNDRQRHTAAGATPPLKCALKQASERSSEHLKPIWVDTVVFDPHQVRHLIETIGASQIFVGTDYPYDMHYVMHALLDSVPRITEDEKRAILGGNGARLIGFEPADPA